jgi:membrane protease YdiL (CAAX protease family)
MHADLPQRRRVLWLAIAFEGGLGVFACLLSWLFSEPLAEVVRVNGRDTALGAAASVPMLALFVVCVRWPLGPLARIKDFADEVVRPLFAPCTVLELALIAMLAGVGEELFFRGFLQGLAGRWLTPWGGLLAASVLFGLMHPITPAYIVLAAALGAYLGWVQLATENLLVVIVAHSVYDWLALLYVAREPRPRSRTAQMPQEPGQASRAEYPPPQ